MKNVSHFALLLLPFLFFISITVRTEAEVITLTSDTFSDKVKETDTAWFVKFCFPRCKHCKDLRTLWDDLGKAMEGEDQIEIGEVDCGVSNHVCTKLYIDSYPTFKLFYDGEEVAEYQGNIPISPLCVFTMLFDETFEYQPQILDVPFRAFVLFLNSSKRLLCPMLHVSNMILVKFSGSYVHIHVLEVALSWNMPQLLLERDKSALFS
ncbi:hypothetical protein REPUB_Repub11eG0115500 [Reevesia pubescens]